MADLYGLQSGVNGLTAGADPGGGGVLGVRTPPFWGTPKLHKEGKNVARVRAKMPHFST